MSTHDDVFHTMSTENSDIHPHNDHLQHIEVNSSLTATSGNDDFTKHMFFSMLPHAYLSSLQTDAVLNTVHNDDVDATYWSTVVMPLSADMPLTEAMQPE